MCVTVAANHAGKAQGYFNKCMKTLAPHMQLVPERLRLEELKEPEMLQPSVQMFELMYGGVSFSFVGNLDGMPKISASSFTAMF